MRENESDASGKSQATKRSVTAFSVAILIAEPRPDTDATAHNVFVSKCRRVASSYRRRLKIQVHTGECSTV